MHSIKIGSLKLIVLLWQIDRLKSQIRLGYATSRRERNEKPNNLKLGNYMYL